MKKEILYNGQKLTLTKWMNGKPCLWIHTPDQKTIPKMQFVGGYPNEYCIFIDKLTDFEKKQITNIDGSSLNLEKEIQNLD